ncbi:MAG TPA: glycosyltransferase family 1 protein [Chloroflexota bacterium]|nr:glycosyltransferase family 1 protein [Chloroflexota bacterium]
MTIDLTPVLPGGDNGGAKLVARSLVHHFSSLAPDTAFTLLTTAASHDELADLDAPNVKRQRVDVDLTGVTVNTGALGMARALARLVVDGLVPAGVRMRLKDHVWTIVKRRRREAVSNVLVADLLFAPFTAPFFFDPRVPLVAIVHDLQFLAYPEFFDEQQQRDRLRHFADACARADRLITVSEFVRQTVLANSSVSPAAVQTIHSTVLHANAAEPEAAALAQRVLSAAGLDSRRYLLYPANPWPHKNHRLLLEAFALFVQRHPGSDLALVCTGAPGPALEDLKARASELLPMDRFAFPGYLAEREFAALMQRCRAVIFPSLYEGFGLPVLEAMASDRPVLCSETTSLPEVAGDAALLFDPHDPEALAQAINRLESDPAVAEQLIKRGRARVAAFGSAREMAARYLAAFEEVIATRDRSGSTAR